MIAAVCSCRVRYVLMAGLLPHQVGENLPHPAARYPEHGVNPRLLQKLHNQLRGLRHGKSPVKTSLRGSGSLSLRAQRGNLVDIKHAQRPRLNCADDTHTHAGRSTNRPGY